MIPLFNQINTSLLAGKDVSAGIAISIVFALGLILIYRFKILKKERYYFLICLSWYLFGLLGLGLYKQHIYDHYFGFVFPVVFILFSLIIARSGKIIGIILFSTIVVYSALQNPFRWNAPRQLATTQAIDKSILAKSQNLPFNFALLAKQNYDPPYRYFFYQQKSPLYDLHDRITTQLFVVCEPFQTDCNPINNPEWSVAAFGWAKIDTQWEINGIKIFRLIPNPTGKK